MRGEPDIPAAEVLAALDRILASKGFAGAVRHSRMLRYLVERTVAGQADQLKEFAVGVDVFDRGEDYDPRIDSIVRVEAGRLRSRLDDYYAGAGADDPLKISLPRGGYVAQFERTRQRPRAAGARWLAAGAAAACVGLVALLAAWRATPAPPAVEPGSIAVLPFQQYEADPAVARLAAQLTDGVTSELARLGIIGVVSHTSAMQFAGERRASAAEIGRALGASLILEGSITEDAGALNATMRIVDPATDRKIWVQDFPGHRNAIADLQRRIAAGAGAEARRRSPAR